MGSLFTGKAVAETRVGDLPAVVPEIAGSASIVGFAQWVVEPDDELGGGFLVRP